MKAEQPVLDMQQRHRNMPRGKKLCKSCSALNSFASKKCTTCGVTFDKCGIVVSIAYLGCGCLLEKKEK